MTLTTTRDMARAHDHAMGNHAYTLRNIQTMGEWTVYQVRLDAYRKALAELAEVTLSPEADQAVAELMGRKLDRRPFTDEME